MCGFIVKLLHVGVVLSIDEFTSMVVMVVKAVASIPTRASLFYLTLLSMTAATRSFTEEIMTTCPEMKKKNNGYLEKNSGESHVLVDIKLSQISLGFKKNKENIHLQLDGQHENIHHS